MTDTGNGSDSDPIASHDHVQSSSAEISGENPVESPSQPQSVPGAPKPTPQKSFSSVDVSDSFSRRGDSAPDNAAAAAAAASVYSEEKTNLPAWMKNKDQNKYEKYGSRPQHHISESSKTSANDQRYDKYMATTTQLSNRVKRATESNELDLYKRIRGPDSDKLDASTSYANYNSPRLFEFKSNINRNDDINSIVRSHYNQRTFQSKIQGSRTKSPIYKLRNFNNAIKYILLGNYFSPSKESDKPSVILDLCCGKGGDLNKCEFVSVDQYVGIDISDASIKEAFSRYMQNKARFIPQSEEAKKNRDSRRYNFEACFATGDCFSNNIPEILEPNFPGIIDNLFPVDCVSMQFAMHYAFETEEKVRTMLTNVTKSLRPGGTFIGTIPSSDFIRDKIVKKEFIGERKFGNDLYSVTFEKDPPSDGVFRPPFGCKYTYYLKDAIDEVPEYVVPFEYFRLMCEDYGLILKYKKSFIDIFNQEIPKYFTKLNKNLIQGMKRSDGKYGAEGAEKEAVGFYIGFVFEKLGG